MREKILYGLTILSAVYLIRNLYVMLLSLPDEAAQGAIYRIFFFHVPAWITCFTAFFLAGIASVVFLIKKNTVYDDLAVSSVEIGVAFTVIGLITGSIWGRVTWGIWWTWDARLTSALICLLVYFGYLMLRRAIDDPTARATNSAVLCIFGFTSVIITFKAIDWWRTQHPGAVLSFRTGGGNIDPAMELMVFHNCCALMLLAGALLLIRMRQEQMQRRIDALRFQAHSM